MRLPPSSTLFPYTTLFRSLVSILIAGLDPDDEGHAHALVGRRLCDVRGRVERALHRPDRKSTRLNSSHTVISYAVFCLKKKKKTTIICTLLHHKKILI